MSVQSPDDVSKDVKNKEQGSRVFKVLMVVVLSLILVTFLMPSAGVFITSSNQVEFGSYDGIPITYTQDNFFGQQVNAYSDYYSQYGNDQQMVYRIYSDAFRSASVTMGLEREAGNAGVMVTDQKVLEEVVQDQRFYEDGTFSMELYNRTPANERLSMSKSARQTLVVGQYASDLIQKATLSDKDLAYIQAMQYPQRKIAFVTFKDTDYPDSEVAAYGEKNKALFRTISLARISVASEADAQRVLDELAKGDKPFEAVAQTYSTDSIKQQGGALDWRSAYEIQADFENAQDFEGLFSLTKGALSGKIKTIYGWSVFKLMDGPVQPDFTQSAVLERVRTYLLRNDRGLVEDWLKVKAGDFAGKARGTLTAAASAAGLKVDTSDFFPVNYGNLGFATSLSQASQGTVLGSLGASESFYKAVFSAQKGTISDPQSAGNSVIVFEVLDEQVAPPADAPDKKDSIRSFAMQNRSQDLENSILRSEKYKDNFQQGFTRLTNGQFGTN